MGGGGRFCLLPCPVLSDLGHMVGGMGSVFPLQVSLSPKEYGIKKKTSKTMSG